MIGLLPALLVACVDDRVPVGVAIPPELDDPDTVRFLALGDAGNGSATQRRVAAGAARACAELGCDLVVLLGDNLYPRGMESPDDPRADARIAEMYADTGAPVYLVLGNHDYAHGRDRERAGWQVAWAGARDGVESPANAWVTDAGPVRFVALDTNAAFQFGASFQAGWLHEQLARSTRRWNVVFGHHPYKSNGKHGNAGAYDDAWFVPLANGAGLRELFDDELCGAADLYLCGHDHNRQLLETCGVSLVVSGGGGGATPIVDRGNDTRFASGAPGAAWFELTPTGGRVVFVDQDGAQEASLSLAHPRGAGATGSDDRVAPPG